MSPIWVMLSLLIIAPHAVTNPPNCTWLDLPDVLNTPDTHPYQPPRGGCTPDTQAHAAGSCDHVCSQAHLSAMSHGHAHSLPAPPCTWGCSDPQTAGRNPPPMTTVQSLQAHWTTAAHMWHLLPFWSSGEAGGRGLGTGGASRSQRPFLGSPESLPADSALGASGPGAAKPQVCPQRLPGGASIKAWEEGSHSGLGPSPDPGLPYCPRWCLSVNGGALESVPAWWGLRPAAHTSGFFWLNVGGAVSSQPSQAPS